MGGVLHGKKIAFLATHGVEQIEITEPWRVLQEAGAETDLVSLEPGDVQAFEQLEHGAKLPVDRTVAEADATEYDGLVLPGSVANPDFLRRDPDAVSFVRAFFDAGKPVGAICHGPALLIEADVVRGRTLTSWPSLETDLRNAGATWVDEEVHVEDGLVTSRAPGDLPAFVSRLTDEIARHGVGRSGRVRRAPAPRAGD